MMTLLSKLKEQLHHHFVFSWSTLFVSGLAISYRFAENSVARVLILYFTWKDGNLAKAAIVVSFEGGLSGIMALAIAHVSDAYIGRFTTVALTTIVYFLGLVVLSLNTNNEMWIFYGAAVLIALGRAGQDPPLKAFLGDQISMKEDEQSTEKERVEARTSVWWRLARFLGSAISIVCDLFFKPWKMECRISAIMMLMAYMIFLSGFRLYSRKESEESPVTLIYKVFKAAMLKWRLQYPNMATQFYNNYNNELPLSPNIPILRSLDKAAIADSSFPEGKLCTVGDVRKVKQLLKMVPMWTAFLVYGLVQTTGSAFFYSQAYNLKAPSFWNDYEFPILALYVVDSLSCLVVSCLFNLVISKLRLTKSKNAVLIRIGAGMASSLLCCFIAWIVEVRRLGLVKHTNMHPDEPISMTIFWLIPQFILLGLMEGLAEDGLDDLLYIHFAPSMDPYGPPLNDFVFGIGSFLTILCILVFGNWFGATINQCRLDKYYLMLTFLNIGNLCLTLFFCYLYADKVRDGNGPPSGTSLHNDKADNRGEPLQNS